MKLTYSEWDLFCSRIDAGNCFTVSDLLAERFLPKDWIALKHDVETKVDHAVKVAEIEASYGIKATFYVQAELVNGNEHCLKYISSLGHEVSYHYDVLDAHRGDFEKANLEFKGNLKLFEELGLVVKSVCPHGNPLMKRNGWSSNKDFFRNESIALEHNEIFDLVVQGKEKIPTDYAYISDAGYSFKVIEDITNNDISKTNDVVIDSIDELLELVRSNGCIVSIHPHRWAHSAVMSSFFAWRFRVAKKVASFLSRSLILKKFMTRFYFLAKKM